MRPILSDRCFFCHGPNANNQKSEFRIDTLEQATADLGGYAGIVPGDLEKSEVHLLIHATILHLFGVNHERLTFKYQGRHFRPTDLHGHVVKDILA